MIDWQKDGWDHRSPTPSGLEDMEGYPSYNSNHEWIDDATGVPIEDDASKN